MSKKLRRAGCSLTLTVQDDMSEHRKSIEKEKPTILTYLQYQPIKEGAGMAFFDRMRNGFRILGISFHFMATNKLYFLFPILKLANIVIWIYFGGFILLPIVINSGIHLVQYFDIPEAVAQSVYMPIAALIFFYINLVLFFVVSNYLSIIISRITMHMLEGRAGSIAQACRISMRRVATLLGWSSIQVVVILLLSVIRGGKDGKQNFLQQLLGDMLGAAWDIVTFFMHPVLALEKLGPIASIKKSFHVMKATFGETVTATMGFGLVQALIFLPLIGYVGLMMTGPRPDVATPLPAMLWILSSLTILGFMIVSTTKTIFQTAIYAYTQGKPTGPFPEGLIKQSFEPKK